MNSRLTVARALRHVLYAGASAAFVLGAGAPAFAADEATAPVLEEVVVTGSRIASPNLTSTSPIQVLSRQEIQLTGTTDVGNLINLLPGNLQNNVADLSNTQNPLSSAAGATTADLRGLGPQRTLVLVDGRRLGIADANTANNNPAPDLDQIPAILVKRVDVVTGGASSVYGSDAVAGVINFIMRHDFEGLELDAQYGFDNHKQHSDYAQSLQTAFGLTPPTGTINDGYNRNISLLMGSNFAGGKGNVEVFATYLRQAPVTQAERDYSACKINGANNGTATCSGSSSSNIFRPLSGPNAGNPFAAVAGQFQPWNTPAAAAANPPALFNSNPYQYLSRDDTRTTAGFLSHYEVNEHADVYMDFSFMNDRSQLFIAPSGLFQGSFNVNCNNPLMSAQQQATVCSPADIAAGNNVTMLIGRRNVEGGGRGAFYEHTNYRGVLGVKGEIGDGWKYDVYGSYYYTSLFTSNDHYLSAAGVANALQVVNVGGVPTCKVGPPCVPYNIFTTAGLVSNVTQGVTQAALDSLSNYGTASGTVKEKVVSANVNGDLGKYGVKLPTATDGLGVDVGIEHRSDALTYRPDLALGSGDLLGGSGAATTINNAIITVDEYFAEFRLPLIQEKKFAEDLLLEGGYRYSDYSLAGGANTYKLGLQWAPIRDVRLRTSYNRAIRAPSIIELFNPAIVTQTASPATDPCAGAAPTATLAQCQRTGVTAAQYGHIVDCIAGQCGALLGGNAALKPEIADTYTIGFTVTPEALPNFTASVDWYDISLKGQIGTVPLPTILNKCLDGSNLGYCSLIVRTNIGSLWSGGGTIAQGGYINGALVNIGKAVTRGVDIQFDYKWDMGRFGKLNIGSAGTYLLASTTKTTPTAAEYDCQGLFGAICQTVNPKWRNNMRFTWETPYKPLLVSLNWRYIDSVKLDTNTTQTDLTNGKQNLFNAKLPSFNYFDLAAIWSASEKLSIRGGINNILDKDPPIVSSLISGTGTPNTYPTYDLLGREVFVGVNYKF